MKSKKSSQKTSLVSRRANWIIVGAVLATLTSMVAFGRTVKSASASAPGAHASNAGSPSVLPPMAMPNGYSLSAIAQATAYFNTGARTGASPDLPCLVDAADCMPVQILYVPATGATTNTFTVSPATVFYVPVLLDDDSPPIIGSCPITATTCADFPNVGNRGALLHYMYAPQEFALQYSEIVVDGVVHSLGSDYLVEVKAPVPPGLADGSGTQYITSAAFLAPLTPGTHTVEIRANANGQDVIEVYTAFGLAVPFPFSITYTVIVENQ